MRMVDKHFFKPLLPGFHGHLTIPAAFLLKYIEGTNEHRTVKLRSDASKITWKVKIEDGHKVTNGWKEFALAHDLRVGDILIFRQEKDMNFHVTVFGPSCCEIQYESCLEDENNLGKIPKKKKVKKNPRKQRESTSCFVLNVAPSTLHYDTLYFPMSFTRAGLGTSCGEVVLMDEKGRSWTFNLKRKKDGIMYITGGWTSLCHVNGLKVGDLFTLKLIQGGRTLVLRLSTIKSEEIQRKKKVKKNPKRETKSSSLDSSSFVANITSATLRYDTMCLPKNFTRENGLDTRCGEIFLMNEKGISWMLNLKRKNSCGTMYITRGWRSFCNANGLRAGSFFTFKLIQTGGALVLRKCPFSNKSEGEECSEGDEIESLSTESDSEEESNQDEKSFKKPRSVWKASSSSPSQNLFVALTLKRSEVENSRLFLPVYFTRMHGINTETKMTMLDKNGVRWSTNLRSEKSGGDRIRLVGGWKEFFKSNCVEIGETIIVKLIWEGDKSCVLGFCSKVKQETK